MGAHPRLSVCIPTHHGRAQALEELVDSIVAQLRGEVATRVEICVSDNASTDGTEELMARYRRVQYLAIVYHRNTADLGAGANIFRSVEIATGDYCWLMGSDDVLAEGSLACVLQCLDGHAGVAGATVGAFRVTHDLLPTADQFAVGYFPELGEDLRVLTGVTDVLGSAGVVFTYLSCNIVNRARWQDALKEVGPRALRSALFPQVFMLGAIACRSPVWMWIPDRLVKSRAAPSYALSSGEVGPNSLTVRAAFVSELARVWSWLFGRRTGLYREMIRKTYVAIAPPDVVREDLAQPHVRLRDFLHMLWTCTLHFGRLPEYWKGTFASLITSLVTSKAFVIHGTGPSKRGDAMDPANCSTRITAKVSSRMRTVETSFVRCKLENCGLYALRSDRRSPVYLSYRWLEANSGTLVLEGRRDRLKHRLRPSRSVTQACKVVAPPSSGDYVLHISLVQEDVFWFYQLDVRNGFQRTVRVTARTHGGQH
jgi:Glycosyl transferase family 2